MVPWPFKLNVPSPYFLFFRSYLENRNFVTQVGPVFSNLYPILAGVPQVAILSPILYNIYTVDQPTTSQTNFAEFADGKIMFFA